MLSAIQPIPVVTASQAQAMKEQAAELKNDLSDLKVKPASGTAAPSRRAADLEREPSLPSNKNSDEPEDLL